MVDGEDCSCSFGGELDGPVLGGQEVEDTFLLSVEDTSAVRVLGYELVSESPEMRVYGETGQAYYLDIDTSVAILVLVVSGV